MPDLLLDAHAHLWEFSLINSFINLEKAVCVEECIEMMRSQPIGEWFVGVGYSQENIEEKIVPYQSLLDKFFGARPAIIIMEFFHHVYLNTAAMTRLGMTSENGYFFQSNVYALPNLLYELGHLDPYKMVKQGWSKLASLGYGRVIDMNMDKAKRPYFDKVDYFTMDWDLIDEALGFKIFLDGSLAARTAALQQPYRDDPGNYGRLKYKDDALLKLVEKAHGMDKPVSCHVIGDRALAQFLRTMEKSRHPKDRVEHLNVASPGQLDILAQLDIPVCISPSFSIDLPWAKQRLGSERLKTSYAWNILHKKGVRLLVGTDSPVYYADPLYIRSLAHQQEGDHHLDAEITNAIFTRDNWEFYDWKPEPSPPVNIET